MVNLDVVQAKNAEHSIIHRREDRFAAWPFNCGMWKYPGDEIVVGFVSRHCTYTYGYEVAHGYDPADGKPNQFLARSTDGGRTWSEEVLPLHKDLEFMNATGIALPSEAPVDFADSDMLLLHRRGIVAISRDRGKSFGTISMLPPCRHKSIMGRPDYVVRPDGACVVFSTVSVERERVGASPDSALAQNLGCEGRPVAYISRNGGVSWEFLAYIGACPTDAQTIQPSGVWTSSGRMLVAARTFQYSHGFSFWADVFASDDAGRTWRCLSRVNDLGAPCHLLQLEDGRTLATYGYRTAPFGIRAKISEDDGETWGEEIVLRDDGGCWDLGYPRSCQLDDGTIFSAYYFNDEDDPIDAQGKGGVRYIAATHWTL